MIAQWPLVIASVCLAWGAGLFASLCAASLAGRAPRARIGAWVVAVILLLAGALGFMLRTSHWDRLFNSFAHLASPITQELICLVIVIALALVYLVAYRRGEGEVPAPVSAAGIAGAALLVVTVGRSAIVPATTPALGQVMAVVAACGAAFALGPMSFELVAGIADRQSRKTALGAFSAIGGGAGALTTAGYLVYLQAARSAAVVGTGRGVEFGVDPTRPQASIATKASLLPFGGECLPLAIAAIGCAVLAFAFALAACRKGVRPALVAMALVLAVVSFTLLLVVFFMTGTAGAGAAAF